MKKIVFAFVLMLGVAATVTAQDATDRVKPTGGDMGLGFKLSGIADIKFSEWKGDHFQVPQLLYRYYLSDKFALRAGLGLDLNNQAGTFTQQDQPVGSPIRTTTNTDSTVKSTNFSFNPGVEYHLGSPAVKIDPYVGVELGISVKGTTSKSVRNVTDVYDFQASNYISRSDLTTSSQTPGGFGFGGNLLAGFNYFFSDNFAIGAEYMLGLNYLKQGGDYVQSVNGFNTVGFPNPITTVISTNTTYNGTSTGITGKVRSTGGINVSVFW